jgi:hypothetical protein
MGLSSLRRYVESLGGRLRLVVEFPDFEAPVELVTAGPRLFTKRS